MHRFFGRTLLAVALALLVAATLIPGAAMAQTLVVAQGPTRLTSTRTQPTIKRRLGSAVKSMKPSSSRERTWSCGRVLPRPGNSWMN